ncbi:hypothetical protein CBR_g8347 [Chara braunii]|uniref:Reverse transcriptase domain-containing protein n=1 Tax=Chara braunii TaxID=69332 RepID=A0A388KM26_CHABU|nr:hypothetical protein CBR_g8347 [Chara braunii]|eukprot:GBG71048.1 hypothetical protein CBR_g8347 [Chara braunii]
MADIRLHLGIERGRGFFRVNSQILETPGVKDWVSDHLSRWESTRNLFDSTAEWLDGGIAIASGVLDVISQILAKSRNKEEAECKRRVEEAEERMEGHPISMMVWAAEREKRMAEWDNIQESKQKRWLELLKEKNIETNDKMSKETFQKLLPKRMQQQMVELKHPFDESAPVACSTQGMLQYARMYYADILTTRRPQDDVLTDLSADSDMWDSTSVKLQTTTRLDLDRPITLEEASQTLKVMARGKLPGVDGLTVEFYAANWGAFGPLLVELYNKVLVGGKPGKGMTHGVIAVLFKKGDKTELKNWRPISLLNVSYKILAKTLARILSKFLPELVEQDQGAFVEGSERTAEGRGTLEAGHRGNATGLDGSAGSAGSRPHGYVVHLGAGVGRQRPVEADELLPSGFRKVERWRSEGPSNTLALLGEKTIRVWDNPAQVRVVEAKNRGPTTQVLVLN